MNTLHTMHRTGNREAARHIVNRALDLRLHERLTRDDARTILAECDHARAAVYHLNREA